MRGLGLAGRFQRGQPASAPAATKPDPTRGHSTRRSFRYRGRDIVQWLDATGFFEVPVNEHPEGRAIRFRSQVHLSGRDGGRTIDLRRLALDGVKLHGRLEDAEGYVSALIGPTQMRESREICAMRGGGPTRRGC